MVKKSIIILFSIMLLSVFTACGGKSGDTENQTGNSSTPAEVTEQPDNDSTNGNKEEAADKYEEFVLPQKGVRPVAVMIDNQGTRPLPQGGIYKAQVVYEILAEGGITRLMPVFWGTDPEMIGPVRSSRHYFLDYAMENDAIYVHFGYSPQARRDLSKFRINNINGITGAGVIFWDLTKDRGNWQDSYTSMKKVMDYSKKLKYKTTTDKEPVFAYNTEDKTDTDGRKAEKIEVRYNSGYDCSYKYDAVSKVYMRFRQGDAHMERITGKQLAAKNIIIQYVGNHRISGDTYDRQELGNLGKGKGWFITCGKAVEIQWSKQSRTSATKYTYLNGNTITLNPGQTWVQITPLNGKVTIE